MRPEEKPPAESEPDSSPENSESLSGLPVESDSSEIVVADFDESNDEIILAEAVDAPQVWGTGGLAVSIPPPPIHKNLDNIAANGGAVGALVLGIWALIGSTITSWSAINALLGIALGLWGISSHRRRMASIGMLICLVAMFLCLLNFQHHLDQFFNPTEEFSTR